MQNLNHSRTCNLHFPALQVVCPFLLWALIGCQWLKPLFRSAVVINLVLAFRHALIKTVATDEARYLRKKCPAVFGHHLHRFENKFNGIVRHKIRQIETNKTWPKKSEKKTHKVVRLYAKLYWSFHCLVAPLLIQENMMDNFVWFKNFKATFE